MYDMFENLPRSEYGKLNLDWILNTVKTLVDEWAATRGSVVDMGQAITDLQAYVDNYFANLDITAEVNTQPFIDHLLTTVVPPLVTNYFNEAYQVQVGNDIVYLREYLTNYANNFDTAMQHAIEDVSPHGTIIVPNGAYTSAGFDVIKPCHIQGGLTGWARNESNTYVSLAEYGKASITFTGIKGILVRAWGVEIDHISLTGAAAGFVGIEANIDGMNSLHANLMLYLHLHDIAIFSDAANSIGIKTSAILLSSFKNIFMWGVAYGFRINPLEVDSCTSLTFNTVWVQGFKTAAYDLHNVFYSSFVSCAADSNVGGVNGYKLTGCGGMSFVACGCEYTQKSAWDLTNCKETSVGGFCVGQGQDGVACGAVKLTTSTNIKMDCLRVTESATVRGLEIDATSTWQTVNTNITKLYRAGVQEYIHGKSAHNFKRAINFATNPTAGVSQNYSSYTADGSTCRFYAIFVVPAGGVPSFTFTAPRKSLYAESGSLVGPGPSGGTVKIDVDGTGYVAAHAGNLTAGTYTALVVYTLKYDE